MLDVGSAENAVCAENVRAALATEFEVRGGVEGGFDMKPNPEVGPGAL